VPLTRREFSRLAALGGAASFVPRLFAQESHSGNSIGYAVVGIGRISSNQFMPGLKSATKCHLAGLVSGHREKADKVAAQYGLPPDSIYSYENFDSIRDNKKIDAVYIALPNGMHAEYTIRAAKAGKHVLCEKPMATSVEDCRAMINACSDAGVKLMIAYRCQYEPSNLRAIQLIRDGKLGTIQTIESTYGFNISPGEWRLNRKLGGGGPLMDVGIYSLNACRQITGEEPSEVAGFASVIDHDGRFAEVEENLAWTMKFPSGVVASCATTYGAQMEGFYAVQGPLGNLELDTAFNYQGQHLKANFGKTVIDEPNPLRDPSQFTRQADYFADCIQKGTTPKSSGEEGLRDMEVISRIYKSAGLKLG
jgi:predicted dehydrogenase